ncbi:MFS general substrate transporter [Annulohypoxylon truncatum]|uniref:MFS general substrate transporter n=1 Tax=Annulohypoxylon truncatum TaxID=327061 RepID=UPI0020086932|nr:MFS general substrate transporter [Annulohypoxylon truncatum]KAI1211639.1 MFS general substrate transporter [Annulohypoxylon truncatum]
MDSNRQHGYQSPSKTASPADMNLGAVQHNPSSMTNTLAWNHIEDKDTKTSHHHNMSSPHPPPALGIPGNTENSHTQQTHNSEFNEIADTLDRYDIGNVANIQPSIYKAFGGLGTLPWVALSYSVSSIAFIPFGYKMLKYRHFKIMCLTSILWMMAGAAMSAGAPAFQFVVLGRLLSALGTSIIYQATSSFNAMLCCPQELAVVNVSMGACFVVGLVLGPTMGSPPVPWDFKCLCGAFAAGTEQITWRWAFILVIPLCSISLILQALFLPWLNIMNEEVRVAKKRDFDMFGMTLHMVVCFLFPLSCTFLGSAGVFGARDAIAAWSAFTFAVFLYVIQQAYSIGTTPAARIVSPFSLFTNRTILLAWICTISAAAAYGAALYYLPIYFAFNRGLGPFDAATRLLPLVCIFIAAVIISSALLCAFHFYKPLFVLGSILLLVGGGLFQTLSIETSESSVMGFESVVAAGLGVLWQLAIPVCWVTLSNTKDRLDAALLSNMAHWGGIAVSLSIAGMIYQGIGLQSLKKSFGDGDVGSSFSDNEMLELLAGVDSPVLNSRNSTEIRLMVTVATTEALKGCFTIILAAGAISFLAAMGMKWEALGSEPDREDSEGLELGSRVNRRQDGDEIMLDGLNVTGGATVDR